MDDLISRQAAIELIESEYHRWGEEYGITDVLCDLDDLPAAEPKKGKWVILDDKHYDVSKCSECGVVEYFNKGWKRFNFCPNCGARMEENE